MSFANQKEICARAIDLKRISFFKKKKIFRKFLTDIVHFYCNTIVPLIAFPLIAIQTVVDFFYYGEVRVLSSFKGQVIKALNFLEVDYELPAQVHRVCPTTSTAHIMQNKNIPPQVNGKLLTQQSICSPFIRIFLSFSHQSVYWFMFKKQKMSVQNQCKYKTRRFLNNKQSQTVSQWPINPVEMQIWCEFIFIWNN